MSLFGLRRNPLTRRRSRSSLNSAQVSEPRKSEDSIASTHTMDSIISRPSTNGLTVPKPVVALTVDEVANSDSDDGQTRKSATETTVNRVVSSTTVKTSVSNITHVYVASCGLRKHMVEVLDDVDDDFFASVDLESYLDFISDERLLRMPRKGSQWDRVLKAAEFFGLQIYDFGSNVSSFVSESRHISLTAIANCQLLLKLGYQNAAALEPTFKLLHDFGVLIAQSVNKQEMFYANNALQQDLADVLWLLVDLIGKIAIHYKVNITELCRDQTVKIDLNATFGNSIDHIWAKKEHLSNHMWNMVLWNKSYSLNIEQVRRKLGPVDSSIRALLKGNLTDNAGRIEGTCEWVQGYLLDFLRSGYKTFTITGASGCGKSMLAGWMTERLQRPIGRTSYETLSHTFASDASSEATTTAFLKSLLSQLLERNVGDVRLFESLVNALHKPHKRTSDLDAALWSALSLGLQTIQDQDSNLVILLDGLNQVSKQESKPDAAKGLHKQLHDCITRYSNVRAITLSRPISHLGGSLPHQQLVITPEHTRHDITIFLRNRFARLQQSHSHKSAVPESTIESLVKKTKGVFLAAYLMVKRLSHEQSFEAIVACAQKMPGEVPRLLEDLTARLDLKNTITKELLEFVLAAERPLKVEELSVLLAVDVRNRTISAPVDVRKHIAAHCGTFVVERMGLIRFRHSLIRTFFKESLRSKRLASVSASHSELVKRMLFYVKCTQTGKHDPSFDMLDILVIENTFKTNILLEYITRNWSTHFSHSTFCGSKRELVLTSEFKELFPESTFFGMLEWSCWESGEQSLEYFDLTLKIRKACFGEKHASVMQNLIVIGCLHRSRSSFTDAANFFYHASIIGQAVLYKFSTVVLACTNLFLTCTETLTITSRTEIVTYRETMIRFMIEICKHKHGESSDHVIKWYEILCEFYVELKEEHHLVIVRRELYEIVVIRYGRDHPICGHYAEECGGLAVVLKGKSQEELEKYQEWIFEITEGREVTDEYRITIILRLCKTYEASGKWILAEKLFIDLWRRITEICRIKVSIELQVLKINIALEYIRFLHRCKRLEEAHSILICLWAEFEHHSCDDETLIICIKEIGILFQAFGLLTVAISIFAKVWGWFKSKGKTTHEEAFTVTVLISEVVEEIETTTVTKKTTTKTTTTITETVVREIYETHYERCRHTKVDKQFFKACMTLIGLYLAQENWNQCEVIIKSYLELTWKAVLTVEAKISLSSVLVEESIIIATQLAICYHRQRQFVKAEAIYLRIYRACIASFAIDHIRVIEASTVLILFYEEYHRHDEVIVILLELLAGYRKHCGHSHHLTIKTLYKLGSIYLMLGRKEAYEYYIEIVTVLNKGIRHCHHEAFAATMILYRYYYEEKRWAELHEICVVLWTTFIHHHHEITFTEEMIITLYERYIHVLEIHAKVEFSVLYKLTIEYRETVVKRFGANSGFLIKVMIALAAICEKNEEHYHEAVTIYEEVIKRTTTVTTTTETVEETIITTVKKRLSKVYVAIIVSGKSTSTTTIERAIVLCLEIFEQLKIEFGCWHEKTLTQLRELVILYHKHGKHEATILEKLQLVVIETITKVTTSLTLYHAALTIASIYVSVGLKTHALHLLHQLRQLIILQDKSLCTDVSITLDCTITKAAFVFLVAFEHSLGEKIVLTFSEMMTDILVEAYLYGEYNRVITTESTIEIVLEVGAKLRGFWFACGRKAQCDILDRKLFALFVKKYKEFVSYHEETTWLFFSTLIIELGKERSNTDFGHIICLVSNLKVKALLEAGNFDQAHEFGKYSFQFIKSQRFYYERQNISYGYKLAEFMAGIDVRHPKDEKLHAAMLKTSQDIVREVFASCEAANIKFLALRFDDIAGLVRLLGQQHNFALLETLLLQLWHSREVQKTWSSPTVLSIGKNLVHAHHAAGHVDAAIELCDTICYNLRRSRGWLDPDAVAMSKLLAELYCSAGRHRDEMNIHEEILREIDEDDDIPHGQSLVNAHLELLKRAYQRLGAWDKHEKTYHDLFARLRRFGITGASIDKWQVGQCDDQGVYAGPNGIDWKLVAGPGVKDSVKRPGQTKAAIRRSCGYGKSSWSGDFEKPRFLTR